MTRRKLRGLLTAAVVVAVAALAALAWSRRGELTPVQVDSRAPDFALPSLDGDTAELADWAGQVVILNFWATWCEPCKWEMPALDAVRRELGPRGLEVVAVSIDAPGALDAVRAFVNEHDLGFPVLLDDRQRLQERYGVRGLPTTYLIGRDGRVRHLLLGSAAWDMEPHITMLRRLVEE